MRSPRRPFALVLVAVSLVLVAAASACGGDSEIEATPTEGPTPTPFSLGATLSIRGQEVTLPDGVAYINQTPDCQQEANASSPECASDLKMLVRGDSYILFDLAQPRVIARRIEPEDEGDFRPLLGLIAGASGSGTSSEASPGP